MATKAAPRRKKTVDPSLSAFSTSPKSPFPDKYDLIGERKLLEPLLKSGDPDPSDPLYARYELFMERQDKLLQMQAEHRAREGADAVVPAGAARQINMLGTLEPGAEDIMTLHTADAMRLFMGVAVKPGASGYPVAGGRRVAAALRALWSLSSNDNPYADWALIDATEGLADVRGFVEHEQERLMAKLDKMKTMGISVSIVQARSPSAVTLGFKSPYGFMIAMLIVQFDFFARVVKSAQRRDLLSSAEGHALLQAVKHRCRSAFERALKFQRVLCTDETMKLSRLDYLPTADAVAKKRVEAVRQSLGGVPKEIFVGQRQPRHTKRRIKLTESEVRLLGQVAVAEEAAASKSTALL